MPPGAESAQVSEMWEFILLLIGLGLIALVIWASCAKESNAITDGQLDKWEEH